MSVCVGYPSNKQRSATADSSALPTVQFLRVRLSPHPLSGGSWSWGVVNKPNVLSRIEGTTAGCELLNI